jgi:hypothetical protein
MSTGYDASTCVSVVLLCCAHLCGPIFCRITTYHTVMSSSWYTHCGVRWCGMKLLCSAAVVPHLVNRVSDIPVKLLQHVVSCCLTRLQLALNCGLLLLQLRLAAAETRRTRTQRERSMSEPMK